MTHSKRGPYRRGVQSRAQDAAQPDLSGVVDPVTAGGLIRYRLWPAKRHPLRAVIAGAACAAASLAAGYYVGAFWAAFVLVGTVLGAGLFFFPTEVALDSHTLHIRAFGMPRTWDLRRFRRIEISGEPLHRVELVKGSGLDRLDNVTLPVPAANEEILDHLRRWVGRQPTGRFEIDDDHVPEDAIEESATTSPTNAP